MVQKTVLLQVVMDIVADIVHQPEYSEGWADVDKDALYSEIMKVLAKLGGVRTELYEPVASLQHMCCEIDKFLVIHVGDDLAGMANVLVVDLHFKERFTLARASDRYAKYHGTLKHAFIGTRHTLHLDIQILCQYMAASFKTSKMEYPPWRTETVYKSSYDFRNKANVQLVC